jgi:hypothetical protein
MSLSLLAPYLCGVAIFGVGGMALGLGGLLGRRQGKARTGPLLLLLVLLAGGAAGLVLLGQVREYWLPPALLAGLLGVGLLFRSPLPGLVVTLATRARVQAALLLLASPVLLLGWVRHLEQEALPPYANVSLRPPQLAELYKSGTAFTDAGTVIPLGAVVPAQAEEFRRVQAQSAREQGYTLRLICTADPSPDSNCHGWLFAGGRAWIQGHEVEVILRDNGYQPVAQPQVNDLAVFYGENGGILHSALVRVAADGLILVESKWGLGGRYVHRPEDQSYAPRWTYYHSARQGHRLLGLDSDTTTAGSPASDVTVTR